MVKPAFLCTALLIATAVGASTIPPTDHSDTPPLVELGMARSTAAPVADDPFVFPKADSDPTATITPALLQEIVAWLSQNFDLPPTEALPTIAFTSPERMTAIRYRGLLDHHMQSAAGRDTVAIYDAASQTIYLPDHWRGATPAEMSVLVHEVAHHLQHRAQLRYACPQEREKLAYRAQERWLQRFGRTLSSEFETDGFTLLVRTSCGF